MLAGDNCYGEKKDEKSQFGSRHTYIFYIKWRWDG